MGFRTRVGVINDFLKKPDDQVLKISLWGKIKFLISGVIYDFGVAMLFVILIGLLDPLLTDYENILNNELYPFWQSIFFMTILPPLLEESIFRWPLKYKRNYLLLVIARIFKTDFSGFWKKHLRIIVYSFAAVFGFIHLTNYSNVDFVFYLLAPIIVGAQLFAGLIFSFFRLKLGFIWALLGHFSHNFILILLAFTFYHNVERELVDNEAVKIFTTGLSFKVDDTSYVSYDSLKNGNLLCLDAQNYSLQTLIDSLYPAKNLKVRDNNQLDLKLYSKTSKGYAREELLEVFKEHFTLKEKTKIKNASEL